MLDVIQLRKDAAEARELALTVHDDSLRGMLLGTAGVYEDMARKLEAAAPAQQKTRRGKLVPSIT